ncbi:hypothetical protein [Rhizobium leguminosarum]|uniref:Uncharacterized protein n=1 Tax=Rhizobium leguminosarum TaxID=384 RepID=A0A7M3DWB2_RHILE|nr:hypothetical protein [Rhizobium leguminosarum]TAY52975.1 hypothetical protein ELH90_15740 [Rhizobium leguminosarum]
MREKPADFSNTTAVQWLCAAADQFLGIDELADMPSLLTGFVSITDHAALRGFAKAAFSLRQLGVRYTSESELRQAVYDFITWEESRREQDPNYVDQPFIIDPGSRRIKFRRMAGDDPRIASWASLLTEGIPLRNHGVEVADPTRPFAVAAAEADGRRTTLDLSDVPSQIFDRPWHDMSARARVPIAVPIAELQEIAVAFDAIDEEKDRASKGWSRRLFDVSGSAKVDVLSPSMDRSKLEPTAQIHLDGVQHLIGLPGTGKTTLVTLLVAWLHKRGYRAVVLLPSIEVCFNLMSELAGYGVDLGLLMGQSPDTRLRHARKLAERIGATDDARGYGRSAEFAELMSVNCALAGFDDAHEDQRPFQHLTPPCEKVLQRASKKNGELRPTESAHLCPASGWCGRMQAARHIAGRHVWLGHVMSLDTRLPPHFVDEHIRHLEAVARAADVVIADEVDGIQAVLDRRAVSEISITGARTSYENRLLDDLLRPFALGENDRTGTNINDYANKATRFIELNRSLIRQLQNDRAANGSRYLAEYDDAFVTGNRLIADVFGDAERLRMTDAQRAVEDERTGALMAFWDACMRQALFRSAEPTQGDERDFDVRRTAVALNKSEDEVQNAFRRTVDLLLDWISYSSSVQKTEALNQLRDVMFEFSPPNQSLNILRAQALFSFLVNVSSVIMQFLSLLPAQHAMMAEGVHKSPIFQDGMSADFARLVPDAVIGRLAGVRFLFQNRNGRNRLILHYVTFEGAPRLLLYRLHQLLRHDGIERGPSVLLTSATSYLEDSPAFHVPVGPDYVLRRTRSDESWKDSRYLLRPIADPQNPAKALRFSGAPFEQRDRILRAMTDHFVKGDSPALENLVADRFSQGRKLAIVVNSYDQVRLVKEHAMTTAERLGRRIIAVVDRTPENNGGDYITAAQVEQLGQRDDWDAVVFPMKALSRGVNIVFGGPLYAGSDLLDKASIGTVAFLTRPHPAQESFDFVAGLVGRASMRFDAMSFPPEFGATDLAESLRASRREGLTTVRRLLRHSVRVGTLGELTDAFVADVMIDVIQTIGRSMRNGCKTRVLFVDAAWAPNSMRLTGSAPDSGRSSYLVAMKNILERLISSENSIDREIYEALYRPYFEPLSRCDNLIHSHSMIEEDA